MLSSRIGFVKPSVTGRCSSRQCLCSALNICLAATTKRGCRLTATDHRIKVVYRNENGHIARASNSALELATGEFVGFLDHDDTLSPDALFEMALAINRFPDVDMPY